MFHQGNAHEPEGKTLWDLKLININGQGVKGDY